MKVIAFFSHPENKKWLLSALIILGIVTRIVLWFAVGETRIYADSKEYIEFANRIKSFDFDGYNGFRTPPYPLLLLLCHLNFDLIGVLQNLMGIALSVLMFNIAFSRTKNPILAFCVGAFSSISFYKLYYERIIMTETLVAFLLAFSLYLLYGMLTQQRMKSTKLLNLGLISALAGLTKPLFLFLAPLYALLFFIIDRKSAFLVRMKRAGFMLLPYFVLVFGWSLFNKCTINYFGLTTLTGYNLSNHSGGFMELAADEYSVIRDIYLEHRDMVLEGYHSYAMTIFLAVPDMLNATGLSHGELSKQLTAMSVDLFSRYPLRYGKSVMKAFAGFWSVKKGPNWEPVRARYPAFSKIVELFGMFVNLSFFLLMIFTVRKFIVSDDRRKVSFELVVIVIVLTGAILQALMELGENRRYAIPFHPLIWYVFFASGWDVLSALYRGKVRKFLKRP